MSRFLYTGLKVERAQYEIEIAWLGAVEKLKTVSNCKEGNFGYANCCTQREVNVVTAFAIIIRIKQRMLHT